MTALSSRTPVGAAAPDEGRPFGRRATQVTVGALVAWVVLLVVARVWGRSILASGRVIRLGAPPLVGWDDLRLGVGVLVPLAVGAALVVVLPDLARRMRWRPLLLVAAAACAAWAVALAVSTGVDGLTRPLVLPGDEYILNVPDVGSPGRFLDTFVERIDEYVVHVRSHPPGMLLALWYLDAVGLGGTGWAAVLCIGGGAAAVPAVLVGTRQLAGEDVARRALPFVAVAPAAVWIATTADALFAGVGAWSVVALVLALDRPGRRGDALAVLGGVGFAALLMLAYAMPLLALVPAVVAASRWRLRPLLIAAAVSSALLVALALTGFWWLEGFFAIREQYEASVARDRPLRYFAVSNLAALGIALGPALAVALTRVRGRLWLVLAGPLAAVAIANVSNFSKGEVERIWLPFTVWILAAGSTLVGRSPLATRAWLALQVVFAIALQVGIRTRW